MRFNVSHMIEAIELQIAQDREYWEGRLAATEAEVAEERKTWMAEYAEVWLAAMRKASAKLRKGHPITIDDLVRDSNGYVTGFRSMVRKLPEFKANPELTALRRLLLTLADETVSTAGLRELGVSSTSLRLIVPSMARGSISGR